MLTLDITFSDGSHAHAWGGVDWIEETIQCAAERGLSITEWTVTDK